MDERAKTDDEKTPPEQTIAGGTIHLLEKSVWKHAGSIPRTLHFLKCTSVLIIHIFKSGYVDFLI
jgi:hypothetical protein